MPKLPTCTQAEIAAKLRGLAGWSYAEGALERTYETSDFKAALLVVAGIGYLCEAAWHHPDLFVSFRRVRVRLTTHDSAGVTARDFELAARIEAVIGWQPCGALTGPPAGKAILHPG